jgi:hypothetical protein
MFLVLISVSGWVNHKGLVRPEGLGKLKKKFIHLIGSRTPIFRLVTLRLNHYTTACHLAPIWPLLGNGMDTTESWFWNLIIIEPEEDH